VQTKHVVVNADRVELDEPLDGAEHVEHGGVGVVLDSREFKRTDRLLNNPDSPQSRSD
jgi:hypothetical protein